MPITALSNMVVLSTCNYLNLNMKYLKENKTKILVANKIKI